ncbi:unnamed protein product [Arctia plantaginis]|uniref:Uncharacterized protein n=1 Tax=Arctia plantaginis TaxID=874455 RepID=A0A8S0ZD61_ARCPL|nr:unnamed protein product [Arctia plantaginis]CAB3249952.1 unnamed protein product [Arctia plantaginis]
MIREQAVDVRRAVVPRTPAPPVPVRGELRGHCSDLRVGAPVSVRETESLRPTLLIFNDIPHPHTTQSTTLDVMSLWRK